MGMNNAPLSEARLAEINGRLQNLDEMRAVGPRDFSDLAHAQLASIAVAYDTDMRDVLADNERLREREAALRDAITSLTGGWQTAYYKDRIAQCIYCGATCDTRTSVSLRHNADCPVAQARALLADNKA